MNSLDQRIPDNMQTRFVNGYIQSVHKGIFEAKSLNGTHFIAIKCCHYENWYNEKHRKHGTGHGNDNYEDGKPEFQGKLKFYYTYLNR